MVAIVRVTDGRVMATATIDKITEREIRTETPYEQRETRREPSRRCWRVSEPHAEMRIPRAEKTTHVPCHIRIASEADKRDALRRVAVRRESDRPRRVEVEVVPMHFKVGGR